MQIDVTYAQSVSSLPSGFVSDINYVVNYLDSLFPNNVTLNIEVSYQNLGPGILGESEASQYVSESYSAVRSALQAEGAPGAAALPATSPLPTSTLSMSIAEAQALGLAASSGIQDGEVFFTNQYQWSYSQTATPGANQYYFIGVVEHEITEVMGRVSLDGDDGYSPMDLYRYSAPGVRDTTTGGTGSTAYFSLDNGTTNLGTWNNQPSNGDLGDWYPQGPASGGNDAFNDYSNSGVINVMSSTDVTLMEAIGWAGTALSPPPQAPTVTAVAESPSSGIVNAGKLVTITVDLSGTVTVAGGAPTLVLNDGGTASYNSGSGSDALTFDYTVQSGQNTKNLLISSINLNGATITDASGDNADFSDLTSFTPGNLEIYTTPTASVTAHSFTVSLQAVAASSFFTITNPSGDSITQYSFEDNGGGSGHFTVAGTVEPDGQTFTVSANNLSSVQYVGGGSAGTDTLVIDAYDATAAAWVPSVSISAVTTAPFLTIQNDYLAIIRTALPVDQATTEANAIIAGTTTETQYVDSLLSQVANTTIPAVAVEASMYGAVGSSAEITKLVTEFLPGQLAYANQIGQDPQVFACLEIGLVFAFGNETGSTAFASNYGPLNAAMPATPAGDAAFAAAATNAIFGSAQTANTAPAILGYVTFLEGFFTANGIVGIQNPTPDQIIIAARAAAWGDGVAIAVANNLGPLAGQTTNFLEDAAQGIAVYSAPLSSQPTAAPFQGAATASVTTTADDVQVTGVSAHVDHIGM